MKAFAIHCRDKVGARQVLKLCIRSGIPLRKMDEGQAMAHIEGGRKCIFIDFYTKVPLLYTIYPETTYEEDLHWPEDKRMLEERLRSIAEEYDLQVKPHHSRLKATAHIESL